MLSKPTFRSHSIVAVQRAFVFATKSPLGTEYQTENPFCCGLRTSGEREVSKKRRGRPRTSRTPENIEAVRQSVIQSPRRSARKQASALGISNHSVRRILHQDLHFHPYKVVVVQELIQQDWINRVETRQHLIERLPDAVVFFSDEVHFHISGCVNKQNMRYWSGANPSEIHQRPLHSDRFTVWCAISRIGIIGP